MARYNPNRESNIGDRIIGVLFGALLVSAALAGIVEGLRWLWHYLIAH